MILFFKDDSMFSLQQGLAKDKVREMRELILERYDKNYDGRLEINEVSNAENSNGTLLSLVQSVGNVCSLLFDLSFFMVSGSANSTYRTELPSSVSPRVKNFQR